MAHLRDMIHFERSRGLRLPAWLDRLISLGIVTSDSKVARRQMVVNLASFAGAFNSVSRIVGSLFYDFDGRLLVQAVAGFFAVSALAINRLHRFGENVAANALVAWFLGSVSNAAIFFGLDSQVHIYFVLVGVLWLLFGVEHWRLTLAWTAVVCVAMLLMIVYAPQRGIAVGDNARLATYLALQSMLNAIAISTVVIVYALILLQRTERDLERQSARADALLNVVLPERIADRLRAEPGASIADSLSGVTILFADLEGFTRAAHKEPPAAVVAYLDGFVRAFEAMCEHHGVEKIKTIGDGCMAAGGLQGDPQAGAVAVGRLALAMQTFQASLPPLGGHRLRLRVGIHTGAAVAGVIGDTRVSYDLWGDAVNVASRMESHGVPGRIHVSAAYREAARDAFAFEERGETEIKGIGAARTYFLLSAR